MNKETLKNKIKSNVLLYSFANWMIKFKSFFGLGFKTENHGNGRFRNDIIGKKNMVFIGKGTTIYKSTIRIRGNNNKIVIGDNCRIRKNCSFWIQGNNCSIVIGNHVTMQHSNHFNCSEDNRMITIGNDCMISNNIIVRTSDGHGIFDVATKKRLNEAKDVIIGNHVWIAPNSRIMKGAKINDGVIVGSNTMVNKIIPANCLAVGMPARVVKEDVMWSSSTILEKYR